MTDLSAEDRALVIQADRDAAAALMGNMGRIFPKGVISAVTHAEFDVHPFVQAFAKHRGAFEAAAIERCATVAETIVGDRAGVPERLRIASRIRQLHSGEGAGRGEGG